jgi:hypothetical protein
LHDVDVWIMERLNGVTDTADQDVPAFPGEAG